MAKSFKAPEIDIPEDDFAANDRLSREDQVRSLAGILIQLSSPMVVAIDAPWGAGKTTFVKMLQSELRARKSAAVYYNAWESDFAPDPLVAFLGEIDQEIRGLIEADAQRVQAWDSLRSLIGKVVRHGVPAAIKLATYNLVDADEITEAVLADSLGGVSSDLVAEYQESKKGSSRISGIGVEANGQSV